MPKSEGGGGGAAGSSAGGPGAGSGGGGSSVGVRVFAVGRYQVTLEESLAEGRGAGARPQVRGAGVWRRLAASARPGARPLGALSPLLSPGRGGRDERSGRVGAGRALPAGLRSREARG